MRRRPASILLLLAVVTAAAAAIWAVSTRGSPDLARYDPVPAPAALPIPRAPVSARDTLTPDVADSTRTAPHPPALAPRAAARMSPAASASTSRPESQSTRPPADSGDSARPHRSDNYGGYGGYGSKERRGDPHAR
jgi:hypothetical protein